ncbi:MAG: cardiolipin synthase B [Chitinivibrionales bacterium]|nr:cardiolipin synthase B [Chitinivibrionales bacterium]MBD3358038.1 cardiolipin synthase B [Chitinivibrionales bacterium]
MPPVLQQRIPALAEKIRPRERLTDGREKGLRPLLEGALGKPFTEGNEIDVLRNGVQIFPAMLEAIRGAQSTIELLTFVYWRGDIAREFAEALAERSRAGVKVFVLLDGFGAQQIDKKLVKNMRSAGVEVQWFRPLSKLQPWKGNHRTHRKLLVCDGDVAFTGGVGIAAEWDGDARNPHEWRDTHFRVRGPAVRHMQAAFLDNWIETGRPLLDLKHHISAPKRAGKAAIQVVRSTASIGWNDTATLFRVMFAYAKSRIWVTTGFFVVDDGTQKLLAEAAKRGVDVRIMYPGRHHDSRVSKVAGESRVRPLLDAGVKIYHYQKTMIHAKIIIVDDSLVSIGSTNLNQRSLLKDDEISLAVDDPRTAQILSNQYRRDLGSCDQEGKRSWAHRGLAQRAKEIFVSPFRRQM